MTVPQATGSNMQPHTSFDCASQLLELLQTEGKPLQEQKRLPLALLCWFGAEPTKSPRCGSVQTLLGANTELYLNAFRNQHGFYRVM